MLQKLLLNPIRMVTQTLFLKLNWFSHGILENQIQALSRTFRHRFKDFKDHICFQGLSKLENIGKKIKDF